MTGRIGPRQGEDSEVQGAHLGLGPRQGVDPCSP